jgi:hypothetical protein
MTQGGCCEIEGKRKAISHKNFEIYTKNATLDMPAM